VHHLPLAIGGAARGAVHVAAATADLRLVLELAQYAPSALSYVSIGVTLP
jgi:hypothetical protein